METLVFCKKYQKELPAMSFPPLPGPAGKELLETVSQKAWDQWRSHQTTLINEKHLDMSDSESRKWLSDQMDKFFNNEDYEKPSGFKALD